MELKELTGSHILQGIEIGVESTDGNPWYSTANYIKFKLDGVTYKALEDPDDGYRSFLKDLITVPEDPEIKLPDINVKIEYIKYKDCNINFFNFASDIINIIDSHNNKIIAEIGTKDINDYYPSAVLRWIPENLSINKGKR